jgi:hypothetical protein
VIEQVIIGMRNKALGMDNLPTQLLKYGGKEL